MQKYFELQSEGCLALNNIILQYAHFLKVNLCQLREYEHEQRYYKKRRDDFSPSFFSIPEQFFVT